MCVIALCKSLWGRYTRAYLRVCNDVSSLLNRDSECIERLLTGLYLLFKCSAVLERLIQLGRAAKALLLLSANEHAFGKPALLEETCEAGNAECSICQVNGRWVHVL